MQVAERNRAIKRVLGGVFGRDKVTVRGSRGTGYGWVSVNIDWTPLDADEATAERARCKQMLRDADIDLGRTYTDDTCQHTSDQCHVNFNRSLYRQTMTYGDGTRAGLRWDDDQWEPLESDSRASEPAAHRYSHTMELGFSVDSATEDGSDITPAMFRAALMRRIADLDAANEWVEVIGVPVDTIDVEEITQPGAGGDRVSEDHRCKAPGCEQIYGHAGAHGARP